MHELLRKKHSRTNFIIIFVLVVLIILLLRYFVLPLIYPMQSADLGGFFATIFNGLLSSLTVTFLIGLFMFWIQPEAESNAKIEIAYPKELPELFKVAFLKSEIWYYKGGCGRYFRTATLPNMAKQARSKSQSKEILVVILDPSNIDLCEKHAIYRSGTASQKIESRPWTTEEVRAELFSTIITTLITQAKEPSLRIKLSLCPHYSSFRIDLSDEYAIITKEDRGSPAIVCHKGTHFYKSYKDEVILSLNQSRSVRMIDKVDFTLENIDGNKVKSLLAYADLEDNNLTTAFYEKVALLCKEAKNPYA
ncbi:hypothetical protein ACJUA3_11980 [Citrobacter freundii]|uniref:hypothetical protein n=1 Tax=Citrobacter freundii TaxID=546 RepID=UPI0038D20285